MSAIQASQLRQLIFYHLDNDMLDTANFIAQRLHALLPRSEDSSHLLALTFLRLRRFRTAYDYSQKQGSTGKHLGCAYVFAQACLQLSRPMEGISALEKSRASWQERGSDWTKHSESARKHLPDTPAVLLLLGKLYKQHGDVKKAGECWVEVHRMNPLCWDAFEGLCALRADLNIERMFQYTLPISSPGTTETHNSNPEPEMDDVFLERESKRQPLAPQHNYGAAHSARPAVGLFSNTAVIKSHAGLNDNDDIFGSTKAQSLFSTDSTQSLSEWDTPVAAVEDISMAADTTTENDDVFGEPPAAPPRRARVGSHFETSDRPRQPALRSHLNSASDSMQDVTSRIRPSAGVGGQKRHISGNVAQVCVDASSQPRRSNRIVTQHTSSRSTRPVTDSTSSLLGRTERTDRVARPVTGIRKGVVGRIVSGNRKIMPLEDREKEKRAPSRASEKSAVPMTTMATAASHRPPIPPTPDPAAEKQAALELTLSDFRHLASAHYASSRYELSHATRVFKALPTTQKDTPFVLSSLAKIAYEQADYQLSSEYFSRLLKLQPSRMEDMEIYSTVLWHLKREAPLSFLCQVLRDADGGYSAPQTWVAIGNAFSLSREHDQAISAFRRATQLAPGFSYAWTLMGHEYLANEAYDLAEEAFRKALTGEGGLGYAGWYGLARTYERMGKLADAERYYWLAVKLNPSNSTLLVCVGVVLERLQNRKGALVNYSRALELAPHSSLARFKKARVLMHLRHYRDALVELEVLKSSASDEANVWFLLGKCYKGLGERSAALRCLTTALNLDAKAAPFIKEAMEALDDDDEEEDSDDD